MAESNKGLNKEMIINAASIAFSKFGYKKTTLDDIASLINIGKTAIYYYFKNKDDIFQEVIKKEAEKLKEALLSAIKNETQPVEKFKIYVFTRMVFLENISNYYSVLKHELFERLQFINQNRTEIDKAELQIVSEILREGVEKKDFNISNIPQTALIIITTLKGLEIPFFGKEGKYDYKTSLTLLLEIFLNGLAVKKI